MSIAATLTNRMQAFIADAKAKAADGFTLFELGELVYNFADMVVTEAKTLQLAGVDKKAITLEAAGFLFDAVALAIPLPFFVPRALVSRMLRQTVLYVMSGVIEAAYARLKRQSQPVVS